ncbi:hypothetical protein ANCCEY_09987 [Ancylostoma ceylanicum]|uniref:G-protein coupled receptors family 1 profile domain-containing protein n=1 Tax=Ancylostoma ceylanicum TaxID=53326 RepID=A0A0D6LFT0_9BILA|nr:hypothetical protein ANCCEY_09987 [Ancylostoma ceylanicum]
MAIASFYALLFILGTCGNAAILAVAYYVKASDSRSKHNTTLIYICVLSIVDFLSMLPLPMTIVDQELIIHEKFDLEQRTITKMHLYKCVDDLGDTLFVVFTLYCFLLAYLMPLLFMIYFYYGMLLRLFKQARIIQQGITGRGKQYAKKTR